MEVPIRRRQLLAVSATGLLAGCYGNVSCTTGIEEQFSDDLADFSSVGTAEGNSERGGDCSRRTTTFCVEVSLTVASVVQTVEGRTPNGETVVSRDVQNESVDHLQVAEYEPDGRRVEREIVLLDDEGTELDSAMVFSECEASRLGL